MSRMMYIYGGVGLFWCIILNQFLSIHTFTRLSNSCNTQILYRSSTSIGETVNSEQEKFKIEVTNSNFNVASGSNVTPKSVKSSSANRILINAIATLALLPLSASARQGAFEMDAYFYLRDVKKALTGETKDNPSMEKRKPIFKSPRTLNIDLATDIINSIYNEISKVSGVSVAMIKMKVTDMVENIIPKFTNYVPIKKMDYSDQYFFDISLYTTYLVAASFIPQSTDRVILRKAVGLSILKLLANKNFLSTDIKEVILSNQGSNNNIIDMNPSVASKKIETLAIGMKEILTIFASSKIIEDIFIFDGEDFSDEKFALQSFNEVNVTFFYYSYFLCTILLILSTIDNN